ncbi:hypothetical protein HMI54_008367 [Coelomomyces lativittatus]|nr:hypothetical protein HMI54_008367 [Coelomomyces lativittatus]
MLPGASATLIEDSNFNQDNEEEEELLSEPGKGNGFENIPLKYKILIFVCASFFSFGSHFAGLSYGHLKNKLKEHLGLSNLEYGLTLAANNLPNSIFPLVAGFLFDVWGTAYGPLVTSIFLFIGTLLAALGLQQKSFYMILFGRLIYGIGTSSANVIQQTIVAKCFAGRNFAMMFALILSINRFTTFLGSVSMLTASNDKNLAGGAWLSSVTCFISICFTILYLFIVKRLKLSSDGNLPSNETKKKPFSFRSILFLPYTFWLLMLIHYMFTGVQKSFVGFATELYGKRDNLKDFYSANKTSISLALAVVLYPFLGKMMDKYGKRLFYVIAASLLSFLAFYFLAFTKVSSYVVMVLLAISIPLKSLALLVPIPAIVPLHQTGIAYAIFRSVGSISASIIDTTAGIIQDNNETDDYDEVLVLLVVMSAIGLAGSFLWYFIDYKYYKSSMQLNKKYFAKFLEDKKLKEQELDGELPSNKPLFIFNFIFIFIFVSLLVFSLIIFIKFSLPKKIIKP